MSFKTWMDDILARWYIPRSDYDERLAQINKVTKENLAMFVVHADYVNAQLRAPDLRRIELPEGYSELRWYSQKDAWPALFNQPSYQVLKHDLINEHREGIKIFRLEYRIDEGSLRHYQKYSGGMFRNLARQALSSLIDSLLP